MAYNNLPDNYGFAARRARPERGIILGGISFSSDWMDDIDQKAIVAAVVAAPSFKNVQEMITNEKLQKWVDNRLPITSLHN